ncbi:MAG: hypothetical protein HQL48_07135 [Gammaproteobacteria bacterium]|nr:hypothetical protein [Gammaproteobacteria bacterium]
MGLLDELKSEASELEQKREAERARLAAIETRYQSEIRPALLKIYHYLNDLIQQIEKASITSTTNYPVPGIGTLEGLNQSGYKINVDSTEKIKELRLQFFCRLPEKREFAITPITAANEARAFFEKMGVQYVDWALRDEKRSETIVGATLQATVVIPIIFQFNADMESGQIRLSTLNFERGGVQRYNYSCDRVNEQWLDELGYYLLRKRATLHTTEISESTREALREKVRLEAEHRERELAESLAREAAEAEEKKKGSLLNQLNLHLKKKIF